MVRSLTLAALKVRGGLVAAALVVGCAPAPPPPGPPVDVGALFPAAAIEPAAAAADVPPGPSATAATAATAAPEPACRADADCGYDPSHGRCGADPRFNKQPPLVDQGIVCHCDAATGACALLRVDPAPCEGDTSCAVRLDPRPHPVRASAEHPYERPRPCRAPKKNQPRRALHHVTCERTNICTLHTRQCAIP